MEFTKKTTILFSPSLHRRLSKEARVRGVSLGELVRAACEAQYGLPSVEDRLRAVRELGAMALPVGTPEEMDRESVPETDEPAP